MGIRRKLVDRRPVPFWAALPMALLGVLFLCESALRGDLYSVVSGLALLAPFGVWWLSPWEVSIVREHEGGLVTTVRRTDAQPVSLAPVAPVWASEGWRVESDAQRPAPPAKHAV